MGRACSLGHASFIVIFTVIMHWDLYVRDLCVGGRAVRVGGVHPADAGADRVRPVTDWGALYRDNATAVAGLAAGLRDDQLAMTVPATPDWTAHRVIAHLAGVSADVVAGRMDGAPGPEWTSRHVGERSDRPVAALVAELRANMDGVAAAVGDNPRPAMVWDMIVHHADLHEALGLGVPPERFWRPVVDALVVLRGSQLVDAVGAYEAFRAMFSRRSRAQIRSWGVLEDAEVDKIGFFGFRDDDQPVPA